MGDESLVCSNKIEGLLNVINLQTSLNAIYIYRLYTGKAFCSLKSGLVYSFLYKVAPSCCSPYGRIRTNVLNLSRNFS